MTDIASCSDYVIETYALTKRYGVRFALDRLDLRIARGRIHAIVGANGAGKSTLFRILLGFLPPTSGQARILGRDSQRLMPEDRGRIGFVNEEHTLPNWMRVAAVTAMQRRHYPRWNQRAFDEVIGHYYVLPKQKIGQLSRRTRWFQSRAHARAGTRTAGAGRAHPGAGCSRQACVPRIAAVFR